MLAQVFFKKSIQVISTSSSLAYTVSILPMAKCSTCKAAPPHTVSILPMAKCSTCKAAPPLPKNLAPLRFSGALSIDRVEKSCAVRIGKQTLLGLPLASPIGGSWRRQPTEEGRLTFVFPLSPLCFPSPLFRHSFRMTPSPRGEGKNRAKIYHSTFYISFEILRRVAPQDDRKETG